MEEIDLSIVITMPNNRRYSIPALIIALKRADYYSQNFGSLEESLDDTISVFKRDHSKIIEWAERVDWSDIQYHADPFPGNDCRYQSGWIDGKKEIL